MPYKDPEKHREARKAWSKRAMEAGYGKALYARRAAIYKSEKILRNAVEEALYHMRYGDEGVARLVLEKALEDAPPVGDPSDYMPGHTEGDAKGQIASGADS